MDFKSSWANRQEGFPDQFRVGKTGGAGGTPQQFSRWVDEGKAQKEMHEKFTKQFLGTEN